MKLNKSYEDSSKDIYNNSVNILKDLINNNEGKDISINNEKFLLEKNTLIEDLKKEIYNNNSKISKIKEELLSKQNPDLASNIFNYENKLERINFEKEKTEKKISQLNHIIKNYREEIEKIKENLEIMKKENNFIENENSVLEDDIKGIEDEALAINKNLRQLEEDLIIYNNKKKIHEEEKARKNELLNEIKMLKEKLNELKELKKAFNDTLDDIYKSESNLIETKKENNINELKINECTKLINTMHFKINKYIFLLTNWVEINFGNNDLLFNKEDIPQIKDLNFVNFALMVDCLEKKRNIINSNLTNLMEKYKEMKNEKMILKNKIDELERSNASLKEEKEKYEEEINNINGKISNYHKKLKLINNYNIYNQKENENFYRIQNEKFNLEYNLSLMRNKIKEINKYNDSLRNKVKEIKNRNLSVNNNFIKRIKDAKNELNAKKVERNIILKKYGNKIFEYENENNKLKLEIEIMQIKIKNIETELQIKNSCLDNIINNNGDYSKEQKYNNEKILINKLVSDNKNIFNENRYLSDENKILKQEIEFLNDNLNNQIK